MREPEWVEMPAGMVDVSREVFWQHVMTETRNVHPRPFPSHTEWYRVHDNQPWGWTSKGWLGSRGPVRSALVEVCNAE